VYRHAADVGVQNAGLEYSLTERLTRLQTLIYWFTDDDTNAEDEQQRGHLIEIKQITPHREVGEGDIT